MENKNQNWKIFLNQKLNQHSVSLSYDFESFIKEIDIIDKDYQEFEDDLLGEIGVYYFDIQWNNAIIYVRKTEQLEGDISYWGLPSEDDTRLFDYWLKNQFDLDVDQEIWFLDLLEEFYLQS